jgi:hypothetical protein
VFDLALERLGGLSILSSRSVRVRESPMCARSGSSVVLSQAPDDELDFS